MKKLTLTLSAVLLLVSSVAVAQPTPAPSPAIRMNGRFVRGAGERTQPFGAGSTSGDLGLNPYSGSYLPRKEGPMSRQNDKEVLEKITKGFPGGCDLVHQIIKDNAAKSTAHKFAAAETNSTGRPSSFADDYEREGHDENAEGWEGFCHNWAPASLDGTINFIVSMDKIYADVPFGIGDLRELATWTYPGSGNTGSFAWFGKRNNSKDTPERAEDNMDPVDLITIFQNYVGPGKPGIVFDVDPGYMVWNQGFYKWNMDSTEVSGAEAGPKQPPAGGKAYKVKLDATYALEGHYGYRGDTNSSSQSWNMFIYTDASGNIVDSAWNGYNKIPDFAWMHTKLGTNDQFEMLKKVSTEGISVSDIEEFCKTMAALPNGNISPEDAAKLKGLLDKICPVLDQNKLTDYIRATAERTGQDYTVLEDAIRSTTDAHS